MPALSVSDPAGTTISTSESKVTRPKRSLGASRSTSATIAAERPLLTRDSRPVPAVHGGEGGRALEGPAQRVAGRPSQVPAATRTAQTPSRSVSSSPSSAAAPTAVSTGITSWTAPAVVPESARWQAYQAT